MLNRWISFYLTPLYHVFIQLQGLFECTQEPFMNGCHIFKVREDIIDNPGCTQFLRQRLLDHCGQSVMQQKWSAHMVGVIIPRTALIMYDSDGVPFLETLLTARVSLGPSFLSTTATRYFFKRSGVKTCMPTPSSNFRSPI